MKKNKILLVFLLGIFMCLTFSLQAACNDAGFLYTVYVSTDDGYLNMREEPTTKSGVICELPDCVPVEIYSVSDGWGYGSYDSGNTYYTGWIYLNGTEATYATARDKTGKASGKKVTVNASDGYMNLRREPSSVRNNIISSVPNGTNLTVTRETDKGWGLVNYGGQIGWIALSGTQPTVAVSPDPTPTPAPVIEESAQPLPETSATPEDAQQTDSPKGTVSFSGKRLISDRTLILVLIGIAIFLVVTVAVLMILIINRGKKASDRQINSTHYTDYPQNRNENPNYSQEYSQNNSQNRNCQ